MTVVTTDTTRADLAECLTNLSRVAAATSRRGRAFQIDNAEYDRHHQRIDDLLAELERAT